MRLRYPANLYLLVLLSLVPIRGYSQNFVTLDFPGAVATSCNDISSSGTVVGYYIDTAGTYHGFSWTKGSFTTIDPPATTFTEVWGVNDHGVMVGEFGDASGYHGFLLRGGRYQRMDYPGEDSTELLDINNAGVMVGEFSDADDYYGGFIFDGESVDPVCDYCGVIGINDKNEVVGYDNAFETRAFLYKNGELKYFNAPFENPIPYKINGRGKIVGRYTSDEGTWGLEAVRVGTPDAKFRGVEFPGSIETQARGINDSNVVVGRYTDASNHWHGFMVVP